MQLKWIDRSGTQQRLYAQVHIIGNGKEGKSWCCWLVQLVLPVGEKRREVGEIGVVVVCCSLFIAVTRVTFPSFAASLCCLLFCWHSREYINQ